MNSQVTVVLLCSLFAAVLCRPRGIAPKDEVLKFEKDLEHKIDPSKILPIEKLMPDHLDAVRMEQDGHMNKDFHKEAFLGEHEEIDDDPAPIAESKIKEIFRKVDKDGDGYMDVEEMKDWIGKKIKEHFSDAERENKNVFHHLDTDKKGFVEWKVYYQHFLLAKGYPMKKALQHVDDYDSVDMKEEEREALVRYRFRWSDADKNSDQKLDKDEFMTFRHPEQSNLTMSNMVQTILNGLDDGDGNLTEAEFCALPPGEVEGEEQKQMDKEWQEERRQEFRKIIDKNGDGIATKEELMIYVDPRNPEQVKQEAENLLNMMDENKDRKISLEEVLMNRDIFVSSKVADVKRSLHDEF